MSRRLESGSMIQVISMKPDICQGAGGCGPVQLGQTAAAADVEKSSGSCLNTDPIVPMLNE